MKEVAFTFTFLFLFCASPFCDVQWLAGFPLCAVVILYSLIYQKNCTHFLWFCLTCKLEN